MRNATTAMLSVPVLIMLTALVSVPSTMAQEPSPKVVVIFQDGGRVEVENLRFRYNWIYSEDRKYINPPSTDLDSDDFHYTETVRNVELSRVVPRKALAKMEFMWSEGFRPDKIVVRLKDGSTNQLSRLRAASAFLLSQRPRESGRTAELARLYVVGTGIIEGQRGPFSARLMLDISGGALDRTEQIKEIIFP